MQPAYARTQLPGWYEPFRAYHGTLQQLLQVMEIDTWHGKNTRVLVEAWPSARIPVLDIALRPIASSARPDATWFQAGQTNAARLRSPIQQQFPACIGWQAGGRCLDLLVLPHDKRIQARMPRHGVGMVGLVTP